MGLRMIKQWTRKKRHLMYISRYISDLRWDVINTVVSSSATGFNKGTDEHLESLGKLIRKYERRRRLLRF